MSNKVTFYSKDPTYKTMDKEGKRIDFRAGVFSTSDKDTIELLRKNINVKEEPFPKPVSPKSAIEYDRLLSKIKAENKALKAENETLKNSKGGKK